MKVVLQVCMHLIACMMQNTSLPALMWSQDLFVWDYVDAVNYSSIIQWFVDTCRPSCVIANRTNGVAQVLK